MTTHDTKVGKRYACATIPQGDSPNAFDLAEGYLSTLFGGVFVITGTVSAFATFSGTRLFLEQTGQTSTHIDGIAVLVTIATASILIVGWSAITRFGPEARSNLAKTCVAILGIALLAITLAVSSLPNLMALTGPAAKIYDWRETHRIQTAIVEDLELNALGVRQLLPGWRAEAAKACPAADREVEGGVVSGTGRGAGPVAFALSGLCEQSSAFVGAMEEALAETNAAVTDARAALRAMRTATRDRSLPVIDREDRFLMAGDALSIALQRLRAADLTQVLDAGAQQVQGSVAELADTSAFAGKQVETVRSIRDGIKGLIESTAMITERLRGRPIPERQAITSPDYIEGVIKHAHRFVPVAAAAVGIDLFAIWAFFLMLTLRAGRPIFARRAPKSVVWFGKSSTSQTSEDE